MVIGATRRARQRPLRCGRLVLERDHGDGPRGVPCRRGGSSRGGDDVNIGNSVNDVDQGAGPQPVQPGQGAARRRQDGRGVSGVRVGKTARFHRVQPDLAARRLLRSGSGKTASAYSQYQQAASVAAAAKDARQITAEERIAAVEPLLARLAVTLAPGAVGVVVRRNGEVLGGEARRPIGAGGSGSYTFEATASGKKTWSTTREIAAGASVIIDVPALEAIVVPAPRAAIPVPEAPSSARRTIGLALGGVGLVGLGVGAAFGVKALANLASSRPTTTATRRLLRRRGLPAAARGSGRGDDLHRHPRSRRHRRGRRRHPLAHRASGAKAPARSRASSSRLPLTSVTAGAAGDAHSGSVWLRGAF